MNAKQENAPSSLDNLKWLVVVLLIAGGVGSNSYYAEQVPLLWRVIGLIVLALAAGGIAYYTEKGRAFAELLKEARIELKKVVWPTKTETHQSTLIVIVVSGIMAVILWGLDTLLSFVIKALIG